MRKVFFIAFLLLALGVQAQVAPMWIIMPDSLCPYLTSQHRKLLCEQAFRGVYDTIPNQLGGHAYIESLDKDNTLLRVRLTNSLTMELSLRQDTVILAETVCAPLCSTVTRTYNLSWMLLSETRSPWDAEQTEEERRQLF